MVDLPYPPGLLDSSAALPKNNSNNTTMGWDEGVGNSIFPQKISKSKMEHWKDFFGNAKKENGHRPLNGTILLRSALKNRADFFVAKSVADI